ncbi:kelch repeat-containing protein [Cryptococcus bacillisporus CA1873]|uniref:Kelch repeat-containing protein n=1 Tax=Cryptococcus bacillisporus CA1873 TaxID=1296111 RepID=A0ABR5BJM4_CRYGA|nr:kelch repeat-containing protein [Cryptococcus bacillisporus CA1873]|eukprot:KIR69365.1 kelch repeat-containing protein [Cryptococcus gattii CA1873]
MTHPTALPHHPPDASLHRSDGESSGSTRNATAVPFANADATSAKRLPAVPNGQHSFRSDSNTPPGEIDNAYEQTSTRRRRAGTRSERPSVQSNTDLKGQRTSSRTACPRKPFEPHLPSAKNVPRAPTSSMYFSPVPCYGFPPNQALRAHTGTLVGERIWVLGGVDKQTCFRDVACFDTESFMWSALETQGERFPPLRAHTTTLVGDKLYIFGGGDGPSYSNDVWILDTTTHRFSRPSFSPDLPLPPPRRAHSAVLYQHYLIVFGGGNGQAALNDVWALDVSDPNALTWTEWKTKGDIPQKKGYHTANLIGDKMVVFGGSDGHASFADVHVLNLKTCVWTLINTDIKHNRLSHTSTQVGSYLFVIGGHNGQAYAQDVLLFNLVTLQWEVKLPRGLFPSGRGYHVALLHDSRIFLSGGYNGETVFDDFWILDLSASAYLPQVTTFQVDENLYKRSITESSSLWQNRI